MSTIEKIDPVQATTETPTGTAPAYTLGQLVAYILRLGALGFGGPVALVGYMHRDLVERRRWISEADYKEGLTLAQLMPGPLAAQLAIYLGYVHYRFLGATLVGGAFVLPSFLMVLALGWAYLGFGGLDWMQAVFYGVGASVIAIITLSAVKLTRKTLGTDRLLWALYLVSAAATIITETENVLFFLGAGMVVVAARWRPSRLRPPAATTAGCFALPLAMTTPVAVPLNDLLLQIALFFTKAGAFVFGSGLAIVPFLYGGVVKEYGWLDDHQFLDAVAVAMITPGPVVITTGFIGYIVTGRVGDPWSGLLGATVAALATFLPCYFFTIIPAPYFKRYGKRPGIVAFVDGVTAAAIGAIAGACIVLGRRTLFADGWTLEVPKLVLLVVSLGLLMRFKKLPEPVVILGAAVVGLVLWPFVRP
ncbi:chromate transporter [Tautonia plasticadhaerens]|uniref:Putative chromate transport protein n=1 Tax=Tautonia plasticadhaerens TaxID=2527974 RepID=A0A518HF50_9BACT|nr:chromate transporter [Tautonia plasticadhaerens]QDV39451.1 putative chromate transport protein [Tautonia plasticadhaerens]